MEGGERANVEGGGGGRGTGTRAQARKSVSEARDGTCAKCA